MPHMKCNVFAVIFFWLLYVSGIDAGNKRRVVFIGVGLAEVPGWFQEQQTLCSIAETPGFDEIVQVESQQRGLEYAIDVIVKESIMVCDEDGGTVLVAASRGASIALEAVRTGVWICPVIFFSPILNGGAYLDEDNYGQMLRILANNGISFSLATGSSVDEEQLIYEPLLDAITQYHVCTTSLPLVQFEGDHNWYNHYASPHIILDELQNAFCTITV